MNYCQQRIAYGSLLFQNLFSCKVYLIQPWNQVNMIPFFDESGKDDSFEVTFSIDNLELFICSTDMQSPVEARVVWRLELSKLF